MSSSPTYSPIRHTPATARTQLVPTRRYARYAATHPIPPLKGLRETLTASVSYRASVPAGHAYCEVAPSYRALFPAADRQNRSFKALSGKGSAPATPPPFRHTPFRPRPRHTAPVWRNPGQHPHRDGTFTFSAKEKDPETGYSYFGSRYYSSDLSVWLSVDPQSDKYPSLSPYVYCANNPVKLVDPNGEAWEINQEGYIRECGDKNDHTLYAVKGKGEEFGDRVTYKSGKQKGKEVSIQVTPELMDNIYTDKTTNWDPSLKKNVNHDYTSIEFLGSKGMEEAKSLICFFSKYTDVEWSIVGGLFNNEISTTIYSSHIENREYMGANRAALLCPKNHLFFFFHSHPRDAIFGYMSDKSDRNVCDSFSDRYASPNAQYGIIHKGVFYDLKGFRVLSKNIW